MDTAKVFMTGRSQAVRLPKAFRFECDEVCIRRVGSMVVMFDPRDRRKMLTNSLGGVTDDFMAERDQGGPAERRQPL